MLIVFTAKDKCCYFNRSCNRRPTERPHHRKVVAIGCCWIHSALDSTFGQLAAGEDELSGIRVLRRRFELAHVLLDTGLVCPYFYPYAYYLQ